MYCHKCGAQIAEGAVFCHKCGLQVTTEVPLEQAATTTPSSSDRKLIQAPAKKQRSRKPIFVLMGVLVIAMVITVALYLMGHAKYPDEFLFDGLPATRFLDMTRDDMIAEFGQPEQTAFDGIEAFTQEGIFHVAYSKTSGKVIYISFSTEKSTFNGKQLATTAKRALETTSSTRLDRPFWFKGPIDADSSEYDGCSMYYDSTFNGKIYSLERTDDSYRVDFHVEIFCKETNEEEMIEINLYTDEWVGDTTDNIGMNQILICEFPIEDIFEMTEDEIIETFGTPDTYIGPDYFRYEKDDSWEYVSFVIDSNGYVDSIAATPEKFSYNGHTFDVTYSELEELLGGDIESLGASGYSFTTNGYSFIFYIPRDTDRVYDVEVSMIDTDIPVNNDEYLGDDSIYYPNLDSSLVGRWRAYDGGSVEFDENGNANVSFRPGGSILSPDYFTWEVSNGQILLSSHFSDTSRVELSDYNWGQRLILSSRAYVRAESSTSLVGVWDEVGDRYRETNALVLSSDGTGTMSRVVSSTTWARETIPISWWTDDTNFYVEWTLLSAYDYTISGDMLTIYFSNGSQIYTKVGN